MRSYSGLLVLETLFDSIPSDNPDLVDFANSTFSPQVLVTSANCQTSLGEILSTSYTIEGRVELATGDNISYNRIKDLLAAGHYLTNVRSLNTCIAPGGVCQACYAASRPFQPVPPLGSRVRIDPEYIIATDVFPVFVGDSAVDVTKTTDTYDFAYVYNQGQLIPPSSYVMTDNLNGTARLTLLSPISEDGMLTVRYTTVLRSPYMYWLANTYSGSILGIKPLLTMRLPIRKALFSRIISETRVELLVKQLSEYKTIPQEAIAHLSNISDLLEKALYVIALHAVYLNVKL
jgi:hypothetical protein